MGVQTPGVSALGGQDEGGSRRSSWLPRERSGRECSPPLSAKHERVEAQMGLGPHPLLSASPECCPSASQLSYRLSDGAGLAWR